MSVDAGLSQIAIMTAGTLGSTPSGVIVLGITANQNAKVTRHKGIKIEAQDHELPNLVNLYVKGESPQCSIYEFMTLLTYRGGNCDIQIVTTEGKVYKFPAATYPLGIKPSFTFNDDSRMISVEIEGAFPKTVWDTILSAASSATAVDLGFTPISGVDYDKQRIVYPLATECPLGTELYTSYAKRTMTIEPKETARINKLTSYNIANFNKLTASITIDLDGVSLAEEIVIRAKGTSPSFVWKDGNGTSTYDKFSFAANVLDSKFEVDDDGSKKTGTYTRKGTFPIAKITGAYGTGNGGSASDGGITGGTLTIAA